MTFAEELKSFQQTHRYSELVIGGRVRECNKAISEE